MNKNNSGKIFCSPPKKTIGSRIDPNLLMGRTKACANCREKHIKCDGLAPCSRCIKKELECEFKRSATCKKRGPKKGKIQHLEKLVKVLSTELVFLSGPTPRNDPIHLSTSLEQGDLPRQYTITSTVNPNLENNSPSTNSGFDFLPLNLSHSILQFLDIFTRYLTPYMCLSIPQFNIEELWKNQMDPLVTMQIYGCLANGAIISGQMSKAMEFAHLASATLRTQFDSTLHSVAVGHSLLAHYYYCSTQPESSSYHSRMALQISKKLWRRSVTKSSSLFGFRLYTQLQILTCEQNRSLNLEMIKRIIRKCEKYPQLLTTDETCCQIPYLMARIARIYLENTLKDEKSDFPSSMHTLDRLETDCLSPDTFRDEYLALLAACRSLLCHVGGLHPLASEYGIKARKLLERYLQSNFFTQIGIGAILFLTQIHLYQGDVNNLTKDIETLDSMSNIYPSPRVILIESIIPPPNKKGLLGALGDMYQEAEPPVPRDQACSLLELCMQNLSAKKTATPTEAFDSQHVSNHNNSLDPKPFNSLESLDPIWIN